jgi:GntR family transcriptional regulator
VREQREPPPIVADLADIFGHIEALGTGTSIRLIAFDYTVPPQAIAAAMSAPPNQRMQRSIRVRSNDGGPFSYLVSYVPERVGLTYTEAELATTPLFKLLERTGIVADRVRQTIAAALAGPEVAQALKVEVGSPLVSVTRVTRAGADAIEHLHALYRPDRYVLSLDLTREPRKAKYQP